jgi:hypothetical protein
VHWHIYCIVDVWRHIPFDEHGFVWFWHEPLTIGDNGKVNKAVVKIGIVVLGVIVEPEIHDDGGKQIHWPEPDIICCKHGHDVIVQLIVKQPSKFKKKERIQF